MAVPALNEAPSIVRCVSALLLQSGWHGHLSVHVLANNCIDETAAIIRRSFSDNGNVSVHEISLDPARANAGWARRIAMEQASADLHAPDDLIVSTDADTVVAPDWITRTVSHFERGFDAVAGIARIRAADWGEVTAEPRTRLALLAKYQTLLAYLQRDRCAPGDEWPNHGYEGGASLALRYDMFRAIGGCPPVPSGEDRALFDQVRKAGGRVKHALDVKVYTSGRLIGRAAGGTADTIRGWCGQSETAPIQETWRLNAELGHVAKTSENRLSFAQLPEEILHAQALVRASRRSNDMALTA